ncbi:MAG: alcohol dehydrogenase catalytic domain-containing protein [Anaerolineae bacterium]|nr:alcohol dehydrogenase catalytic domain-containing protein [Anaerolineae bacterium]
MRAVMFDGALHVVDREWPQPDAGEVVIRPRLMGICNTDLELMQGYKDFSGVLGHEFVGEVIEGAPEWMGRRVVGEINVTCGSCDFCRQGIPSQCRDRRALGIQNYDGAFAEAFRLPVANLWTVPTKVPDEIAVFAEPLAAVCQIVEAVHIRPIDRVIIIGAGKLGLLAAQVLRLTGCDLSVIVRRERQSALLAGLGVQAVARDKVADGQADIVIDCTGNAGGFAESLDLVRPRGTVVLKSTYADLPQADLTRVVVEEIKVVGSRCGPFGAALRLMQRGLVDLRPLIEARYTLEEAEQAFQHARQPGTLKVLLHVG